MRLITAAGGVVLRKPNLENEILLIHRNGIWDLPKGKCEFGETVEACARREVAEEVGIPEPDILRSLGTTQHEYEQSGEQILKTTHWYLMETTSVQFTPQKEEQIEEVAWVPLEKAIEQVGFENLRKVLFRL
jgi:8-oxo-dGTP pyrophosphatase MutT (NUDIX family)